jgi:glutamate synthase domain-containing protein 1
VNYRFEKDMSACGLTGFINRDRTRVDGTAIIASICNMDERSDGRGGGFAAYGIYPEMKDYYAFHMLYTDLEAKENTERFLDQHFLIKMDEEIPTRKTRHITDAPILWRHFLSVDEEVLHMNACDEEDYVVDAVMKINSEIPGAFVMSSGKNMGAFKAVGYPGHVAEFYKLDDYKAWTWIAHGRFPTNTPGWWGGAHPFTLLDWSIVHNGEISSYGINKRYLEMFGYKSTLMTDTEVTAYMFDMMLRRHRIPIELATKAMAAPFWAQIDHMPEDEKKIATALRQVYSSGLLNGPFAFILGHKGGMVGINDRIKLRPLVAAEKGEVLYVANEESAIREIASPDKVWMPVAGEPVIAHLKPEKDAKEEATCIKV